jgi:regulatory LuxR family protein
VLARLERHDDPRSAFAWLQRSPAVPTLRTMLRGELAISHQALDDNHVGQATDYLCSWLVDDKILPARNERVARFERWTQTKLETIGGHPDRAQLAAYARWQLQPNLADKLRRGVASADSHRYVYMKLRVAVQLTAWLHSKGLALASLRQAHVDAWLAGVPSRAVPTRAFVDWLHRAVVIPRITVTRPAPRTSTTPIDHATRLRQARELLDDDALELPTRIGGCLLLLYGQPISRVALLRRDRVDLLDDGRVLLRLGVEPIEVPGARPLSCSDNTPQRTGCACFPAPSPAPTSAPSACVVAYASSASERAPHARERCSRSPQPCPLQSSLSCSAVTTTSPTTGEEPQLATRPATPPSPALPPEPGPRTQGGPMERARARGQRLRPRGSPPSFPTRPYATSPSREPAAFRRFEYGTPPGQELHIAHDTVRTHVRNAMGKLGARSRAHLVAKALAAGQIGA